ncbi:MAG: respiratory nitrate reductase subunit gamma [Anaerolineae bacterium]|jgi:nitrate reductase gamma subunit
MFDTVLFVALPYIAVVLAIVVGIYRYVTDRFSFSSYSSQFLESRRLFWGSVLWHYGIVAILGIHLVAFLFPGVWGALTANRTRLYVMEVGGLAMALLTIVGMVLLLYRRISIQRVRAVTTKADWLLMLALFVQVLLGFWVAFFYRWGSDWFLHTAQPWLISLLTFQPRIEYVSALPAVVQWHLLWGFVIIALIPFTRLVHAFAYPITYLWRPLQVVIWNRARPAQK